LLKIRDVLFSELFTIVVDMLAILVHGTLAGEMTEKGEENKKVYQSLIRKLKVCIPFRGWLSNVI